MVLTNIMSAHSHPYCALDSFKATECGFIFDGDAKKKKKEEDLFLYFM